MLNRWVKRWPTPVAGMADRGDRGDLNTAVKGYPSSGHTSERLREHWPTPHGMGSDGHGNELSMAFRVREGLSDSERTKERIGERRWPTPTAKDSEASGSRNTPGSKAHPGISLTDAVRGDGGTGRGPNSQGLWPTPVGSGDHSTQYKQGGMALGQAARLWPTPTRRDGESLKKVMRGSGSTERGQERIPPLAVAVQRRAVDPVADFRTPSSRDWKGMSAASWRSRPTGDPTPTLPDQIGGQLNPTWVEWLMGFPAGWTDCEHLGTPSFRKLLKSSPAESTP
jgi:hypothetical protein